MTPTPDPACEQAFGEPLTHFFHCWRFPAHHACAVALIERQQVENDGLLAENAGLKRNVAGRSGRSPASPPGLQIQMSEPQSRVVVVPVPDPRMRA